MAAILEFLFLFVQNAYRWLGATHLIIIIRVLVMYNKLRKNLLSDTFGFPPLLPD